MLWSISFYSNNSKCIDIIRNSFISLYALSRVLQLPLLAAICAAQQLKCFFKWKSSKCIIRDLIRFIPPMSHYSWTKESKSLKKKLKSQKNSKEIKEYYWLNSLLIMVLKLLGTQTTNSLMLNVYSVSVMINLILILVLIGFYGFALVMKRTLE